MDHEERFTPGHWEELLQQIDYRGDFVMEAARGEPGQEPAWQTGMSHLMHLALYALMIGTPLPARSSEVLGLATTMPSACAHIGCQNMTFANRNASPRFGMPRKSSRFFSAARGR